jgi:signal transduction histidine kinase/ligand-binding sensor domain-containing protein
MLGIFVSFPNGAAAQSSDLTLRQMTHRVFTSMDGAPSDIVALAQTSDGTLWIGGRGGLSRFDGVRFVPYPGPGEEPLKSINITVLHAAADGSLWIGFRPQGVAVLRDGHLTSYYEQDGFPDGSVSQFAEDHDGSLWAAARLGLAHFKNNHWEKLADDPRLDVVYGVLVDRAGTLWVATDEQLLARPAGATLFRKVDGRGYAPLSGIRLAAAPDGKVWAAPAHDLIRIERRANSEHESAATIRGLSGGPLMFDRDGNLWAAAAEANALLRVSARELALESETEPTLHPDIFSSADGLNSARVFSLLADRERNIWVGTTTGLHRFSRSNVVRDAAPACFRSVFASASFAAGDDGDLLIACDEGTEGRVDRIHDGAVVASYPSPVFNTTYRDQQGTIWFGGPTALGYFDKNRIVTKPMPAIVRGRIVQTMIRDAGAMWVSVSRRGLFKVVDGEWSRDGGLQGMPLGFPYVATADGRGSLWFGYTRNRIARVIGRQVQLFDAEQGLDVGNVMAFLASAGQIWVGGELGFARFDGERFVPLLNTSGADFRGTSGIVKASNGDFWLNAIAGIVRIPGKEMERAIRDPAHRVECETFDYLDGVPGMAVQLRQLPTAIETTDGRIWFGMTTGIVSIDPTRRVRNPLPPPVTIWSLSSGSIRYPNTGAALRLPKHTRDLQIEYSAGSLTVPERVRFRYKLEGLDSVWQDVGGRREARYTNLGPGRYAFRVTAANNDGVWNDTGASIAFTIAPAFYQTRWFYALCALTCVAVLIALYRIRVRQVAAQVRGRLEARLGERERIARDLHDTLLQGMQGLIWRFQAAADSIPPGAPARRLMEESLDRADQLLEEGRDKVKDLRPAVLALPELAQALAAEGDRFAQLHSAKFSVSVQGVRRELHPLVREEGFLIGREALSNAFHHARATNIEAEITYGDAALQLRIRDDGHGIDATVLDAGGKPGHFGVVGMRERARKLGAQLDLWSKPGAGTEVDLRVPADVAYTKSAAPSRLARFWSRE